MLDAEISPGYQRRAYYITTLPILKRRATTAVARVAELKEDDGYAPPGETDEPHTIRLSQNGRRFVTGFRPGALIVLSSLNS
jgi:hypothetical protein